MTALTVMNQRTIDDRRRKDLRTLARFIEIYCHGRHGDEQKERVQIQHLPGFADIAGVEQIVGKDLHLCPHCRKLLLHAFVKRLACSMVPKPMCKHCPNHCYAPAYRQQIREVMKYAGRKLVLGGRVDYLFHLLF